MRKILVGLLSLMALFIFAENVHVSGCEFETYTIESSITIYVHQWMDLEYNWLVSEFDICDYNQTGEVDVLSFLLDSNAPVTVIPSANFNGLDAYVTADVYVTKDGVPIPSTTNPIDDGLYVIGFDITWIDPNLPADTYQIELSLTFQPTVTF